MLQNMNNTTMCHICIWIIPEYLKVYSISPGKVECKPSRVSLSLSFEGRKIPLGYIKGGVLREDSMNSTAFSPPFYDCVQVPSVFSQLWWSWGLAEEKGSVWPQLWGVVQGWAACHCQQQQLPCKGNLSLVLQHGSKFEAKAKRTGPWQQRNAFPLVVPWSPFLLPKDVVQSNLCSVKLNWIFSHNVRSCVHTASQQRHHQWYGRSVTTGFMYTHQ